MVIHLLLVVERIVGLVVELELFFGLRVVVVLVVVVVVVGGGGLFLSSFI